MSRKIFTAGFQYNARLLECGIKLKKIQPECYPISIPGSNKLMLAFSFTADSVELNQVEGQVT